MLVQGIGAMKREAFGFGAEMGIRLPHMSRRKSR